MSIVITRPEIEALIKQRLETGAFQGPEDVILDALRSSESGQLNTSPMPATSAEEKARAFVQWAASHRDTPLLSDDAVSRASQ